jgi:hypothetical protein
MMPSLKICCLGTTAALTCIAAPPSGPTTTKALRTWPAILSVPVFSAKRHFVSQERMNYLPAKDSRDGQAKVIYKSKDGRTSKTFEALDWLAQLVTHIPNKGEQMVRYYGYYSNKSRGMRKKAGTDDQLPALVESAVSSTAFRRNWARLIQKIYQIDPLLCPKCQGPMKVISFIEDGELIKKILVHLRLWETRNHDPPQSEDVHIPTIETELTYDYTYSQLPPIDYWTQ